MSLYALVHVDDGTIEAVFVFPSMELAVTKGLEYARRSGFSLDDDPDWERFAIQELRDHCCTQSDRREDERVVIKRVFCIDGSVTSAAVVADPAVQKGGGQ